ncbi:hypothetical protein G5G46_004277 [Vibrio vulnificus]|uniref:hypothetical protein n=1 Tax=Vibrio parahaemolyticus TaxID=670 RepID=UPI0005F178CE|nr:hypothetical protein [Vibrio parahaemolyticus]EGQ8075516.1 hypothetical protein [Vibrio vulnificus]
MQKFVAVLGLLCVPYVYAESIEGCYLVADEIISFSSEESEIQSTYVKISRSAGNYSVEGLIWGGLIFMFAILPLRLKALVDHCK